MTEIAIIERANLPSIAMTAEQYAAHATASSTARAYRSAHKAFAAWYTGAGHCPLPADPATAADYLTHRANGGTKVAALSLALAAIVSAHRLSGHPMDAKTGCLPRHGKAFAARVSRRSAKPNR